MIVPYLEKFGLSNLANVNFQQRLSCLYAIKLRGIYRMHMLIEC